MTSDTPGWNFQSTFCRLGTGVAFTKHPSLGGPDADVRLLQSPTVLDADSDCAGRSGQQHLRQPASVYIADVSRYNYHHETRRNVHAAERQQHPTLLEQRSWGRARAFENSQTRQQYRTRLSYLIRTSSFLGG
jgi:hypothetical protein